MYTLHAHGVTHTHTNTRPLWATWSSLASPPQWSDQNPRWFEVIHWELSSLSPAELSGLLSCSRLNLSLVRFRPVFQQFFTLLLPLELWLFDSRWFFTLLSLPLSLTLSLAHLHLSFLPDQRVIFLFPNPAMHSFCYSISLCFSLSSPCVFFSWPGEIRSPPPPTSLLFPPSLVLSLSLWLFTTVSLSLSYLTLLFSLSVLLFSQAAAWVGLEWEGLFW